MNSYQQTETVRLLGEVFCQSVLEQAREIIVVVGADGKILSANQAAAAAYGYSVEELTQMDVRDLRAPETRLAIDEQLKVAQQTGIVFRTIHMRKNGERFQTEVSSRRISTAAGEAVVSIVRDISEMVVAEEALRNSAAALRLRNEELTETYKKLVSSHAELTAAYEELSATEEELRQQFDELLVRDEAIRRQNAVLSALHDTAVSLMHRSDPEELLQRIISGAAELVGTPHGFIYRLDTVRGVFRRSHGVGIYQQDIGREIPLPEGIVGTVYRLGEPVVINEYEVWQSQNRSFVPFPGVNAVLQIPLKSAGQVVGTIGLAYYEKKVFGETELAVMNQFAEIASLALNNALLINTLEAELVERTAQEQAIRRLAYFDTLTGLPNRTFFREHLAEVFRKTEIGEATGALLHIDLDELKTINDTLGHSCGDRMIAMAGEAVVTGAGSRALVARVAGDEFMILLDKITDRREIACIADRILENLCREYDLNGTRVHMSGSMGIAVFPDDGITLEDVLRKTDLALYEAKRSGKSTWRFCEAKSQMLTVENMLLKQGLRDAIGRGELVLHYQPLVNIRSGCVTGFEALLRWKSPVYGNVPPNRFIPLTEENGSIREIGKWVLREACHFIRELVARGNSDISVAVNVSPRQLAADDFVPMVAEVMRQEGINPRQLELEITENVLIASVEDSTRKLAQLRDLGVRLALDDFGTGFSSLTYLRSLPVGTLKIDKSFIDKIVSDDEQRQFICSIIQMAHVLGLSVVAEGVETEQQFERLVECQCDFIQGYLFSRPVAEHEAVLLIDKKKAL